MAGTGYVSLTARERDEQHGFGRSHEHPTILAGLVTREAPLISSPGAAAEGGKGLAGVRPALQGLSGEEGHEGRRGGRTGGPG